MISRTRLSMSLKLRVFEDLHDTLTWEEEERHEVAHEIMEAELDDPYSPSASLMTSSSLSPKEVHGR